MHPVRALCLIAVAAASSALAACGPASPSRSPTPASTPDAPSPTPTPAPDTQTVTVLATGVGSYALAAIPVAVLHNDASAHAAEGVVVHFVTHRAGGGRLGELDSVPVNIVAGEQLAVSADCTDACNNAVAADVTVTVGMWVSSHGAAPVLSERVLGVPYEFHWTLPLSGIVVGGVGVALAGLLGTRRAVSSPPLPR